MKTVAFIPARYKSNRFPGKPLAHIAGKPMIQRVYECAAACPELSGVCVATDDERIAACVHDFGGNAVMTEKSHRSGTDRVSEAAFTMGLENDDLVVNIQGDQPFFHPSQITRLVSPFAKDESISMTTLKYKIKKKSEIKNPNHVKVVTDAKGFGLYFSRSPIPFYRNTASRGDYFKHLGLYAFRMGFLLRFARLSEGVLESAEKLEQLRALENGIKIKVVETPFDSIEVDIPEDIKRVEKMLLKQPY
jgi:3-deoxy-manno-octulosonate cytidylyltransferase (CMP-KDO synthetase)